jgi:hypothetical protein
MPVVPAMPRLSNVTTRRPAARVVDQGGIPVVEIPAEMLQQNEWHLAGTQIVVRVLDSVVGRDSPDRGIGVTRRRIGCRLFVGGCHDGSLRYEIRRRHRMNPRFQISGTRSGVTSRPYAAPCAPADRP